MIESFQTERFIRLAEDGNTTECLILIEKGRNSEAGLDINAKDDEGWTALHKAAQNGHEKTISKLIELGACVQSVDSAGVTPLHMACRGGHVAAMKTLMRFRADSCVQDDYGWSPIHQAADRGHTGAVMALLEAGADLWAEDKMGMTALHLASKAGSGDLVLSLLERGAVVGSRNGVGKTALEVARIGSVQAKLALIAYGAEQNGVDADLEELSFGPHKISMHQAAARGGFHDRMVHLLSEHPSLDSGDAPELLADLARQGQHFQTAAVIESSVAMHAIDKTLSTLLPGSQEKLNDELFVAAKTGDSQCCVKLIQAGADVNARDMKRWTPLHWAARYEHAHTSTTLIHGGADVHAVDNHHATALHRAAGYGDTATVFALIESGAHVHAVDERGLTPLAWAHHALQARHGQETDGERTRNAKVQTILALISHGSGTDQGPVELKGTSTAQAAVLGEFTGRIKTLDEEGTCCLSDLLAFAKRHARGDSVSCIEALLSSERSGNEDRLVASDLGAASGLSTGFSGSSGFKK